MGDTNLTPYDAGTFGSQTSPTMAPQLRKVAAAAREAIIDLAVEHFKAERQQLTAENGQVTFKTGNQSVSFGQLTKGQEITRNVTDRSLEEEFLSRPRPARIGPPGRLHGKRPGAS